jgi:hypothetical protein
MMLKKFDKGAFVPCRFFGGYLNLPCSPSS